MSVQLHETGEGRILKIRVTGRLTRQDYGEFIPEIERMIAHHGKIRILLEMDDFHGWTIGAMWEDVKFDLKHFRDIERLALIGDRAWERGMATFCRPFTTATIRYFDKSEAYVADAWIHADMPVAQPSSSR
jgi:hypothetical protein